MDIEMYANMVFLAFVGVCLAMMIYGTVFKRNWGINIRGVACPECGLKMRRLRMPNSRQQAMWGGHTCPNCQCEMDKWGRKMVAPVS